MNKKPSYTPKLPKAVIEFEVRDKDGNLLQKGKLPAKSWVGNIIGLISSLLSMWNSTSSATGTWYTTSPSRSDMLDTSNNARGLYLGAQGGGSTLGGSAPTGDTTAGILVGNSDTPVIIGQYNLQYLINHGTGSGQLSYGATTVESITKDTTWLFRVIRTFTNNSGASITVKEIGLFVRLGHSSSPYYFSCMLARDVLTSPITIPNGSTLTVRYIISHSV
jgi:hypothetical protein